MATAKPQTAQGYDAGYTLSCERALVTLLRSFGTFKTTLRLVGGLVPRYLTPEMPPDVPAHAGTSDVDIVLNLQVLSDDKVYKKLARQLKDCGFKRYVDPDGKGHNWRWVRMVSEYEHVMVEFLQDSAEELEGGALAAVQGEGISALAIDHLGIVQDWYLEKEITADLLDDKGIATETVRYADLPAFIALKAFAFDDRAENKDAADLLHVMRYAGPIEQVARQFADRYREGKHLDVLDKAVGVLRRRFCDGNNVQGYLRDGPVACARFMYDPDDPDSEDARIREQRDVSAMVTEFLRLVSQGRTSQSSKEMGYPTEG